VDAHTLAIYDIICLVLESARRVRGVVSDKRASQPTWANSAYSKFHDTVRKQFAQDALSQHELRLVRPTKVSARTWPVILTPSTSG
jgi:hypothetical protein